MELTDKQFGTISSHLPVKRGISAKARKQNIHSKEWAFIEQLMRESREGFPVKPFYHSDGLENIERTSSKDSLS